jgi:hypothetical protein
LSSEETEEWLNGCDFLLFWLGWTPQSVEALTMPDVAHYLTRYVAAKKRWK